MGGSVQTGKAWVTEVADQAMSGGVRVREPGGVVDLLFDAQGHAAGVLAYDSVAHRWLVVRARAVILGTGGAHGLFSQQVSTRPLYTSDAADE